MDKEKKGRTKKKINCRKKGRTFELKAKEFYEDRGWLVQLAPMSTKWQKSQDFFGLFDLIGFMKVGEGVTLNVSKLYVQVKYAQTRGVLKVLQRFKDDYLGPDDYVILLVWKPGKGFKEYFCD